MALFRTSTIARVARSERLMDLLMAAIVVVGYGYFHGGGGANQNARFDAIYSFEAKRG